MSGAIFNTFAEESVNRMIETLIRLNMQICRDKTHIVVSKITTQFRPMIYFELVYEDGMTHSSYNFNLIESIWNLDRDRIVHLRMCFV